MHVGRYNQNHKIFIKITKIGPNEYFTLENKAASNPFTIVSQGATVVRIKNDFLNGMKMHQELLRLVFKKTASRLADNIEALIGQYQFVNPYQKSKQNTK